MVKNRIGIVGGGQLGRMLGFAAKQLGFSVTVIDPTPGSPAGQVVDSQIVAGVTDEKVIAKLAANVDFLTFEIELASATVLQKLAKKGAIVNPSPKTLMVIKDKLAQKQMLTRAKLPVAPFMAVTSRQDIQKAGIVFGYPLMLKARSDGYDGRGNALIKTEAEIDRAMQKLAGRAVYIEAYVRFVKELAINVVRSTTGDMQTYPVVETIHKNNICHVVKAPAEIAPRARKRANMIAKKVVSGLSGAGVFGIEMFLTKQGNVLVNEIAPRVHNSGHYTMEACVTSQFEQHIRAITGLPLGKTDMVTPAAVMVNILGERMGDGIPRGLAKALAIPHVFVHMYGKKESRPERKMGHITATGRTVAQAYARAVRARNLISI